MFKTAASNINQLWANLIVEELIRCGVRQFVLSPGSRCTPLTIAAAREQRATVITHFDERGAAYYALGHARATSKPAALICTSGTATANYYPAVIEASMDLVPMILLTADRPAELRDTGANQTIDQVELYGKYVRLFHDLPSPDVSVSPESVITIANEAAYVSMSSPHGPVHVNCQFREPLAPTETGKDFAAYLSRLERWLGDGQPYITRKANAPVVSDGPVNTVAKAINEAASGLLAAGPLKSESDASAVRKFAEKLQWPVFADIRSGLRLGNKDSTVVSRFDQLLLSKKYAGMPADVVVHFGDVMTSKRFNEYVQRCGCKHYVQIAEHALCRDPSNVVTERIIAGIADFCGALDPLLSVNARMGRLDALIEDNESIDNLIKDMADLTPALTEIAVARLVSKHISEGTGLFLGCSMPVRDMDMYADPSGPVVKVTSNRGASGIDGSIATTAGWANGLRTPATAILGDLAFLHDMNSLVLLKNSRQPVTLIVINNNGGGIFSLLPVYECQDVFERYFGTPHGMSFEQVVGAFGLDYYRPDSAKSFVKSYDEAQSSKRPAVIEVVTDRENNRRTHLALQEKIRTLVDTGKI